MMLLYLLYMAEQRAAGNEKGASASNDNAQGHSEV